MQRGERKIRKESPSFEFYWKRKTTTIERSNCRSCESRSERCLINITSGLAKRHGRHVGANVAATPPGAGARFGEVVAVPIGADEFGRGVWERVVREQAQEFAIGFKEFF